MFRLWWDKFLNLWPVMRSLSNVDYTYQKCSNFWQKVGWFFRTSFSHIYHFLLHNRKPVLRTLKICQYLSLPSLPLSYSFFCLLSFFQYLLTPFPIFQIHFSAFREYSTNYIGLIVNFLWVFYYSWTLLKTLLTLMYIIYLSFRFIYIYIYQHNIWLEWTTKARCPSRRYQLK